MDGEATDSESPGPDEGEAGVPSVPVGAYGYGTQMSDRIDRAIFGVKLVVLPLAFLGASATVIYGAFFIVFGAPPEKLLGVGLILLALAVFAVSLWISFGRPSQWFPPGENTDSRA